MLNAFFELPNVQILKKFLIFHFKIFYLNSNILFVYFFLFFNPSKLNYAMGLNFVSNLKIYRLIEK